MATFHQVQAQAFSLAGGGAIAGATTLILRSFAQIDGTLLTMTDFGSIGYATLEPGNGSLEEQISFSGVVQNANGTATLSGVKTVLDVSPYTETSGLAQTHAGSTTCVLSNTAGFYNQFPAKANDETITGQWTFNSFPITPSNSDASTTVKGVTKLSVAPVLSTSPIAVGDNDTRVPSANPTTLFAAITSVPAGVIFPYGAAAAPTGFLLCDGTSYLRATYAALFAIIGSSYGSVDGTHFNVPDLRGRVPIGVGTGTGGGAAGSGAPTGGSALTVVANGGWKGEETHTLTTPEIPAHTHPVASSANAENPGAVFVITPSTSGTQNVITGSTGGDGAHNNIQPVMGVSFIIKT